MAENIPHFGFEMAPEISAAEREAVSTRPNSALQGAIRATQRSEEFYTPGQLLMMGPQAFRTAERAEEARRKMLVGRAQQGINLSNMAISHRGTQRGHDARRAQEEQARAFMERTRGMDEQEILAEVTPEEAFNNVIMDSIIKPLDVLDIQRTSRVQREEQRRGMRARATVPMENLEKIEQLESQQKILQFQKSLQELEAVSDFSHPGSWVPVMTMSRFDPEFIKGFGARMAEDPEGGKKFIGSLRGAAETIGKIAPKISPESQKALLDKIGSISSGFASGELDDVNTWVDLYGAIAIANEEAMATDAKKIQLKNKYEELRNKAYSATAMIANGASKKDLTSHLNTLLTMGSKALDLSVIEKRKSFDEAIPGYGDLSSGKKKNARKAWLEANPAWRLDPSTFEFFLKEKDEVMENLLKVIKAEVGKSSGDLEKMQGALKEISEMAPGASAKSQQITPEQRDLAYQALPVTRIGENGIVFKMIDGMEIPTKVHPETGVPYTVMDGKWVEWNP